MPILKTNPVALLKRVPMFQDLSDAELQLLGERMKPLQFRAGEQIFEEGAHSQGLFVIESGEVRLMKRSENGREQLLSIERMGASLGEVSAIDGGTQLASAEALGPVSVLCLPTREFRRLCLQYPELTMKLVKVLGQRLRHVTRLVEQLSFSTVRGRLAAYLLEEAKLRGRWTETGLTFELHENNQQLAARIGTVRELVSRNLGRLQSEGLIQIQKRIVCIPDLPALEATAYSSQM